MPLSIPVGFLAASDSFGQGEGADALRPYFASGVLLGAEINVTSSADYGWHYHNDITLVVRDATCHDPVRLSTYWDIKNKEDVMPGLAEACFRFLHTMRHTHSLEHVLPLIKVPEGESRDITLSVLPSGYALAETEPYFSMSDDMVLANHAISSGDQSMLNEFNSARLISVLLPVPPRPSAHERLHLVEKAQTVFAQWNLNEQGTDLLPLAPPTAETIAQGCARLN